MLKEALIQAVSQSIISLTVTLILSKTFLSSYVVHMRVRGKCKSLRTPKITMNFSKKQKLNCYRKANVRSIAFCRHICSILNTHGRRKIFLNIIEHFISFSF